jgi:hypothetical protein
VKVKKGKTITKQSGEKKKTKTKALYVLTDENEPTKQVLLEVHLCSLMSKEQNEPASLKCFADGRDLMSRNKTSQRPCRCQGTKRASVLAKRKEQPPRSATASYINEKAK